MLDTRLRCYCCDCSTVSDVREEVSGEKLLVGYLTVLASQAAAGDRDVKIIHPQL